MDVHHSHLESDRSNAYNGTALAGQDTCGGKVEENTYRMNMSLKSKVD